MAIFACRTIAAYRIDHPNIKRGGKIDEFMYKRFDASDFMRDPTFQEKGRAEKFCDRLGQGHICKGYVTPDGQVASYVWCSTMLAPFEMGLTFAASPSDAYLWDCRTVPKFGNKGLYRNGLANGIVEMQARRTWIVTRRENLASKKGIEAAGFRWVEDVMIIRIWRLVIVRTGQGYFVHWGTGTVRPDQLGV